MARRASTSHPYFVVEHREVRNVLVETLNIFHSGRSTLNVVTNHECLRNWRECVGTGKTRCDLLQFNGTPLAQRLLMRGRKQALKPNLKGA